MTSNTPTGDSSDMVVLREDELDTSLDTTPHNLYFSQAHGAVFIRQALLMSVLGRLKVLPNLIDLSGSAPPETGCTMIDTRFVRPS